MKVVFTYHTSPKFREHVTKNVLPGVELVFLDEFDGDTVVASCTDADMIVDYKFSKEVLSTTRSRYLHIPWTGTDSVDFFLLRSSTSSFTLLNSHDNARTIAEHALALLLAVSRKIAYSDHLLRSGDWSSRLEHSVNLSGKTFLFIGYGPIARELIKLLQGFDPEILVVRHSRANAGSYETFQVNDLRTAALPRADVVVVALPLTPLTEGLIGEHGLRSMKSSAFLVNIARGGIIDEKALYNALRDGTIAGAGLDVWWQYPDSSTAIDGKKEFEKLYPSRFPFHELDNVVMSPHRAWQTDEGLVLHNRTLIANINRIFEGKLPLEESVVDLEKKY